MRTAPPRREDGKFGVNAGIDATDAKPVRGRPFQKGHPAPGRKPGSKNKIKAAMIEIKEQPGVPRDPLEFLEYVQMNPLINFDLRTRAASERARYMYARKTDAKIDIGPKSEEIARLLIAGRERVRQFQEQQINSK